MDQARLIERFPRCRVLAIGDFNQDAAGPLLLCALGAQVIAVGLATAAVKQSLREQGADTSGIVRSRRAVMNAALDRLPAASAVVFGSDWEEVRKALLEREREEAIMDGRTMRTLAAPTDPRFAFARSAAQLAVFTLARAAGADFETAREFSERQISGHTDQDSRSRPGTRRARTSGKRRKAR